MTSRKMSIVMYCAIALAWSCSKSEGDKGADDKAPATSPATDEGSKPGRDKGTPEGASAAAGYPTGEQPQFSAAFTTHGEATRGATLTGTIYVGPSAIRLDIDNHPNSGGKASFIREHDEKDLWDIDVTSKSFDRSLSGDWEHDVLIHVLDDDVGEDIAEGECPFGSAKPEDCTKVADETVSGMAVEKWQYRKRTIWVAPALRASIKEEYAPFRNNPKTQVVELANIQEGEQDGSLFTIPADYECGAGAFCESAPR